MSFRSQFRYMNPYDIHKSIVNEYILKGPGCTKLLQRNSSNDRTDFDVLHENHQFLWDETSPDSWEAQFAKKYYDKLFKEYCIGDLSRYKENKIALRWRIEQEVISGKGQFVCGNKNCTVKDGLRTWEVNFAYIEQKEKKNALVKIRLCHDCSLKLNYHSKKRELKRIKRKTHPSESKKRSVLSDGYVEPENQALEKPDVISTQIDLPSTSDSAEKIVEKSPWENIQVEEVKSRDEEMEDYLQELLL
ncbi:hypothetical protein RN001_006881 [Aquatica leii]|uniref:Protein FRA10AC1 n=1 Tax=Aquatica leii TaxID=1421715 RepID=A0AAN7SIU3_9COLE|nr:hypothetical protein RN001_006881 [Aquatica leii]